LGGILEEDNSLGLKKPGLDECADIYNSNEYFLTRNYIKVDDFGWVKRDDSNYTI